MAHEAAVKTARDRAEVLDADARRLIAAADELDMRAAEHRKDAAALMNDRDDLLDSANVLDWSNVGEEVPQ
jgi:hypothetical protein